MDEPDFLPPPEEEQPEKLRKKWEEEDFQDEFEGKQVKRCPHCSKWIEKRSFSCLYCGQRIFQESGPIGRMARWIADGKILWLVLALIILSLVVFILRL